ncbi:MAG: hypothetical protein ACFB0Z_13510 [Candidatus Phaeomarinobacter sp.]
MRAFVIVFLAIVIPGGVILALEAGLLDEYVDQIPAETLILQELNASVGPDELDGLILEAIDDGRQDDAEMYVEIAAYMNRPLRPQTQDALTASQTTTAVVLRNTGNFVEGFVTGEGRDNAAFAGAVTSDLTVIGDIRDIGGEGSKLVAGEEYSEIVLGLSVVGLAVTAGTVASAGGGLPARVGVSLLKVAKKAGTMTKSFTKELGQLVSRAVDFPALRRTLSDVSLANPNATRRAIGTYADNVKGAELFPVLARMDDMRTTVGPAESVRLMKYVKNTRDLDNVADMSKTLGVKTRGIIELTGKTSLRAFKGAINILRWMVEWVWALGAAILGWLGLAGSRRVMKRRRIRIADAKAAATPNKLA